MTMALAWTYPAGRYYEPWYGADMERPEDRSDHDIKSDLLDRVRTGPYEDQYDIDVTVDKHVVILTGSAATTLAKRTAGDDAWDTAGVVDVSNQIVIGDPSS